MSPSDPSSLCLNGQQTGWTAQDKAKAIHRCVVGATIYSHRSFVAGLCTDPDPWDRLWLLDSGG